MLDNVYLDLIAASFTGFYVDNVALEDEETDKLRKLTCDLWFVYYRVLFQLKKEVLMFVQDRCV